MTSAVSGPVWEKVKLVLVGLAAVSLAVHAYSWWTAPRGQPAVAGGSAARAVTGDAAVLRREVPGCRSGETVSALMRMLVARDVEAFQKGAAMHEEAGECVAFEKGARVFVTDMAVWQGVAKVRRVGAVTEYWVDSGFLEKVAGTP